MATPFKHKSYYFTVLDKKEYARKLCYRIKIEKIISGLPVHATAILYWNFHEPIAEGRGGMHAAFRQPVNEFLLMDLQFSRGYSLSVLHSFLAGLDRINLETDFIPLAKLIGAYEPTYY